VDRWANGIGRYAFNAMIEYQNKRTGSWKIRRRKVKVDGRYRNERTERRFKKIELESEGTTK